jgi:hypothetical protein
MSWFKHAFCAGGVQVIVMFCWSLYCERSVKELESMSMPRLTKVIQTQPRSIGQAQPLIISTKDANSILQEGE